MKEMPTSLRDIREPTRCVGGLQLQNAHEEEPELQKQPPEESRGPEARENGSDSLLARRGSTGRIKANLSRLIRSNQSTRLRRRTGGLRLRWTPLIQSSIQFISDGCLKCCVSRCFESLLIGYKFTVLVLNFRYSI